MQPPLSLCPTPIIQNFTAIYHTGLITLNWQRQIGIKSGFVLKRANDLEKKETETGNGDSRLLSVISRNVSEINSELKCVV